MKAKISIEKRSSFDFVRYANCWEDASILVKAIDTGPGKSLLSIASAGDNSLAMLTLSPSRVVAVDLSTAQIACTELRKIAIEKLEYDSFLLFLGYSKDISGNEKSRIELYNYLREFCSINTRTFWDERISQIESGIINHGKFERYFSIFRNVIMPLIHDKKRIAALLQDKDLISRKKFYSREWNSVRWRLLFRFFFGRRMLGRIGRDPEFFRYVNGQVAQQILHRTRYALTRLPTHDNPYLHFILTGTFGMKLPFFARPENYAIIKKNIGSLELYKGTIDEILLNRHDNWDGYNLSDIFEYMDKALFKQTVKRILTKSNPGSRLVYWNMLVPRDAAMVFPEKVNKIQPLTQNLFKQDQAFFYQAFNCDEVII